MVKAIRCKYSNSVKQPEIIKLNFDEFRKSERERVRFALLERGIMT